MHILLGFLEFDTCGPKRGHAGLCLVEFVQCQSKLVTMYPCGLIDGGDITQRTNARC